MPDATPTTDRSPLITLTGLWKRTDRNNQPFLAAQVGRLQILIFPNRRKATPDAPDYNLCVSQAPTTRATSSAPSTHTAPTADEELW
ncbi:MAG: hypothetical protein KJ066_16255 [Acidobacteria bacterium]|nr:hypothetical protein [Acidobacteriota bacterium]